MPVFLFFLIERNCTRARIYSCKIWKLYSQKPFSVFFRGNITYFKRRVNVNWLAIKISLFMKVCYFIVPIIDHTYLFIIGPHFRYTIRSVCDCQNTFRYYIKKWINNIGVPWIRNKCVTDLFIFKQVIIYNLDTLKHHWIHIQKKWE